MMTHKITIKPVGTNAYSVSVDGNKVSARSVDVHMNAESLPEIEVGLIGEPDMEIEGMVQFDYTPKTVINAAKVIKTALIKNDITGFLAMNSLNKAVEEIGQK